MSVSVKNVVAISFMCLIVKVLICNIAQVNILVMYKNGSIVKNQT